MAEEQQVFAKESFPSPTVVAAAGPQVPSGAADPPEPEEDYDSNCVFCRIVRHQESSTEFLHCENEDLVCFKDIRPVAPHHYLVVTKKHIKNCKELSKNDIELVENMVAVGNAVLERNNFTDFTDVRMGFHKPPFCSIYHLHLHVMAPVKQFGFLSKLIYKPDSYWFITADHLLETLRK